MSRDLSKLLDFFAKIREIRGFLLTPWGDYASLFVYIAPEES